ncbi:MAG: serine hydrolase [Armatimonadota bacterium]|nr:serine hydrolase [Armatimonadota bacterium]
MKEPSAHKVWFTFAISIFFLFIIDLTFASPKFDPNILKRIDTLVEEAIAKKRTPSAVVVIGTADKILFAKAYGNLTYDNDSPPATLDTIYDLASVSKAVGTTTATMLLVEEGKLSLDDPVSKYLPAWNTDDKKNIKVRHLLCHISGLPAYTNAAKTEEQRKQGESKAEALIRRIASLPLEYKTGEGWKYSCLNFITLARINEEAAGMSQETFLRRRLFVPLGMLHTGYYLSAKKKAIAAPTVGKPNFRQGVVHDPLANYYESEGWRCCGNAGLFSSANDLSKFCQMILSGGQWKGRRILSPETINLLGISQVPDKVGRVFGLGWGLSRSYPYATSLNQGPGKSVLSHSGYTGTWIRIDQLAGTFIIILTNRVYPDDTSQGAGIQREITKIVVENDPIYRNLLDLKKQ